MMCPVGPYHTVSTMTMRPTNLVFNRTKTR